MQQTWILMLQDELTKVYGLSCTDTQVGAQYAQAIMMAEIAVQMQDINKQLARLCCLLEDEVSSGYPKIEQKEAPITTEVHPCK